MATKGPAVNFWLGLRENDFVRGARATGRVLGELDRKFFNVGKTIKGFGKSFLDVRKVGLAATAAAAGTAVLVRRTVEYADEVGKASKAAGVGSEALQEYRFAADQTGASVKQLDEGVRRFQRRFGEAKAGRGFVKDFEAIFGPGVVSTFKTTEEALDATFRKLEALPHGFERSSLAARAFGDDAGPRMALMVGEGVGALDAYRQQARDLGLVLSNELVAKAEETADVLSQLNQQFTVAVAEQVLANTASIQDFANTLAASIPTFVEGALRLGEFFGVFEKSDRRQSITRIVEIRNEIKKIENDLSSTGFERALIYPIGGTSSRANEKFREEKRREIKALIDEMTILQIGLDELAVTGTKRTIGGASDPETFIGGKNEKFVQHRRIIVGLQKLDNDEKKRAASIMLSLLTPQENYNRSVKELNHLFTEGKINEDFFNRGMKSLKQTLDESSPSFKIVEDSLGNALTGFATNTLDAKEAWESFYQSVIAGLIQIQAQKMATAGAGFLDNVLQFIPGFHTGGSMLVGGRPGVDQNVISMRVSKGERIDVSTPLQQSRKGAGGGAIQYNTWNLPAGSSPETFKRSRRAMQRQVAGLARA